jgi:hypothetical protein
MLYFSGSAQIKPIEAKSLSSCLRENDVAADPEQLYQGDSVPSSCGWYLFEQQVQ